MVLGAFVCSRRLVLGVVERGGCCLYTGRVSQLVDTQCVFSSGVVLHCFHHE